MPSDDTTLNIHFTDSGGGGAGGGSSGGSPINGGGAMVPYGSPPIGGNAGGVPNGVGGPTNQIYAAAGSQVLIVNGNFNGLGSGGKGRPVAGGGAAAGPPEETISSFLKAVGSVTFAFTQAAQVIGGVTQYLRDSIAIKGSELRGDTVESRRLEKQRTGNVGSTVGGIGAGIAFAGRFLATKPSPWTIAAGLALMGIGYGVSKFSDASATQEEEFKVTNEEIQGRIQRIGQFGGPVAGALAMQKVRQQRMGFAEANATGQYGPDYVRAQTDLQQSQEQLAALRNMVSMKDETKKMREEMIEANKQITDLVKKVGPVAAEMLRKLRQGGITPIEKVLAGIMVAPVDNRIEEFKDLRKLRDQALNHPVFEGR